MIVYLVVMESLPDKWMSFFSRLGICVSSQAKSEQGISEACCSLAVGFATSQQSTCAWPYGPLYKAHVASWYLNLTSEPVLWHLRTFRKIEMQVRWGFFFFFSFEDCLPFTEYQRDLTREQWDWDMSPGGEKPQCIGTLQLWQWGNFSQFLEIFPLIFLGQILSNTEATWLLHNLTVGRLGAWVVGLSMLVTACLFSPPWSQLSV